MNTPKIELVPFHDHHIFTLEVFGKVYVVMKPIVEKLGLQWRGQLERIKKHPVLAKGMYLSYIPSAGGEQETACLELEAFHGWLITITPDRVPDLTVRETVLRYQEFAFRVVFEHFHGPIRANRGEFVDEATRNSIRAKIIEFARLFERSKEHAMRQMLYAVIADACLSLGVACPAITELGGEQAKISEFLARFWAAIQTLEERGYTWQHSRANHLTAINLPQLRTFFEKEGIDILLDRGEMAALRKCQEPRFIAEKPVNSSDGISRHCFIFAKAAALLADDTK